MLTFIKLNDWLNVAWNLAKYVSPFLVFENMEFSHISKPDLGIEHNYGITEFSFGIAICNP